MGRLCLSLAFHLHRTLLYSLAFYFPILDFLFFLLFSIHFWVCVVLLFFHVTHKFFLLFLLRASVHDDDISFIFFSGENVALNVNTRLYWMTKLHAESEKEKKIE